MSQLKALTKLYVGSNKLASTEVDFIIESFPQLMELSLYDLGLTGEHLRSTNRALTTLPLQPCQTRSGSLRRLRSSDSTTTKLRVRTHVVPIVC